MGQSGLGWFAHGSRHLIRRPHRLSNGGGSAAAAHGVLGPGFHLPTGPAKPPGSGTGIPVRFGRKPVEFKFEFKKLSSTGSYRYTGRLERFTGRFDRFEFKSKFKIACVTGLTGLTNGP